MLSNDRERRYGEEMVIVDNGKEENVIGEPFRARKRYTYSHVSFPPVPQLSDSFPLLSALDSDVVKEGPSYTPVS